MVFVAVDEDKKPTSIRRRSLLCLSFGFLLDLGCRGYPKKGVLAFFRLLVYFGLKLLVGRSIIGRTMLPSARWSKRGCVRSRDEGKVVERDVPYLT